MKIAYDLVRVKEVIESKFTPTEIKKVETHLRKKALKSKVPYITYLRVIGQAEELSASTRLLGIYLLYIN